MKKFLYLLLWLAGFSPMAYAINPPHYVANTQESTIPLKNVGNKKELKAMRKQGKKIARIQKYKAKILKKINDRKQRKGKKSLSFSFIGLLILLLLVGLATLATGFWQIFAIVVLISIGVIFFALFFGMLFLGGVGVC